MNDMKDYSLRLNHPFLLGVYLAVNAITDVYLALDMNDCAFFKAHFIHGNHDLTSTLLDCEGRHRISNTGTTIQSIAMGSDDVVTDMAERIAEYENCSAVLITGFPISRLAGVPLDTIAEKLNGEYDKPVMCVPPGSLEGDWLKGYADTLAVIAKHIDLSGQSLISDSVAIVGYMMDRNEEDHRGNIREMKRMLSNLDLDLACVWPGGEKFQNLKSVESAGTIISMPHGREAARILASRTGAELLELSIPFGIEETVNWLNQIANATGREKQAEAFITSEMSTIFKKLEWLIPTVFVNKRFIFKGDIHHAKGFYSMIKDLGGKVPLMIGMATKKIIESNDIQDGLQDTSILYEPGSSTAFHVIAGVYEKNGVDLFVTDSGAINEDYYQYPMKKMDFGFPSLHYHALYDSPFLGFNGCLCFINRMANIILDD